ncbi:MAG: right-handed parallel beta-helix repeat-containing protein [Draconibacterium sp.]
MRRYITFGLYMIFLISVVLSCSTQNNIEFFVSPDGNDTNPGTQSEPFKSIEKAQEVSRKQKSETPGKSIIVNINEGQYYLEKPIVFTEADSGTENAPVIYRAAEGEKPVFTGSREISNWQVLDKVEKLELLSPEVKGKIYVANLSAEGISDFGDATDIGKRPELFCNAQPQTLARWPNEGFVNAGLAKGKTELPPTYIKTHGTQEGVFEYLDNRQDRWAEEKDIRLGGYWYWDWSDEFQKVEELDVNSRTISISEPYHHYGYRDSLRYFGLNLFSEIDQPGEWYLDRQDGLIYWFPPENINPEKANVTLSVFNSPYMVEIKDCSNFELQGLTFMEGRSCAILISEGKRCLISDCRIERFGEDAIHIENGLGHGVSGCYLSTFGCGGIVVSGGDRKTLTPANHFIENTIVKDFSLYKRTYEPAVYAEGCGIRISHNRFLNSSSSAMRLEGNDIIVEYNEIGYVVNESDDQGGLDMWYNPSYRGIVIRYNHWHNITGGTKNGAAGVRLDDMISGVHIHGNVFERCGAVIFGAVQIHGGKDNLVENNLFYDCLAAVSFSTWKEKHWLDELDSPAIKKKIYEDVDIRSELYQHKYPELKTIREGVNVNTIKNNLMVNCEERFLRDKGVNIEENNTSVGSNGKSLDDFCNSELLQKYGLQSIPLQQMGPLNNRWIE